MMRKIFSVIAAAGIFSATANADQVWTQPTTIQYLNFAESGDKIWIETAGFPRVDNCSVTSKIYLPNTVPYFKEQVSFLLASFHAQSRVQFLVDGCTGSGTPNIINSRVTL